MMINKLKIKRLEKNQKGFSLIELILYMGILSILIVALFQLLTAIFDIQLESQTTSAVSTDAGYILNKLEYDISRADSINVPGVGNQDQILELTIGSDTFTYSLLNDNLMVDENPAATQDQINSFNTKVTSINFHRLSDNLGNLESVTIDFTLESEALRRGGVETESFRTTIGTR